MTKPTYEDATLMIQLAQWSSSSGAQEAATWIFSDEFDTNYATFVAENPPGSENFGKVTKVCAWFETIGTLYKQGLFNEQLLYDWLAVRLVWDRVEGFALGWREQSGEPRIYENFEAMAKAQPG